MCKNVHHIMYNGIKWYFFAICHKYVYKYIHVYRYMNIHRKGPEDVYQISALSMVGKIRKARLFILFFNLLLMWKYFYSFSPHLLYVNVDM